MDVLKQWIQSLQVFCLAGTVVLGICVVLAGCLERGGGGAKPGVDVVEAPGDGGDRVRGGRDTARMARTLDEIRAKFSKVQHLDTEQLQAQIAAASGSPPLLIDVRERAEFDVSHLPGAIHVEASASDEEFVRAAAAATEDGSLRPVVFYCSVGYRSAQVAQRLAGVVDGANYIGSIFEWANRGLPLEKGPSLPAGSTAVPNTRAVTVHPYNSSWGELLDPALRHPLD